MTGRARVNPGSQAICWNEDGQRVALGGTELLSRRITSSFTVNLAFFRGGTLSSSMADFSIEIVRTRSPREAIARRALGGFGDLVKAVIDIGRGVMAIGGELHSDEESVLIADGSRQGDLWGINLYPAEAADTWLEFDSMINVRPAQGNRSRGVDRLDIQERIREVLAALVADE